MLLHPLVWSNTAIVSCLGPSQLLSPVGPVPLYLLSLSSPAGQPRSAGSWRLARRRANFLVGK